MGMETGTERLRAKASSIARRLTPLTSKETHLSKSKEGSKGSKQHSNKKLCGNAIPLGIGPLTTTPTRCPPKRTFVGGLPL